MIAPGLEALAVSVSELVLLPGNPRRGDVDAIARSLAEFGQRKPVTARRYDRVVTAGNHTVLAARQLGWHEVAVLWTDDDENRSLAWSLADNRIAELGGYDDADLAAMIASVCATDATMLAATGWTSEDLRALLEKVGSNGSPTANTAPDDLPDTPDMAITTQGDLWALGRHRLLCGDATSVECVEKAVGSSRPGVVYVDPPYGVSIVNAHGTIGHPEGTRRTGRGNTIKTHKYQPVTGDSDAAVARDVFRVALRLYPDATHVWWGANHYAATAGVADSPCWLVWDKETGAVSFANAELAWTNSKGGVRLLRHMWSGLRRATEQGLRMHPTQKPVALAEWAFDAVRARPGCVVLDCCGGSGSTLIAAHRTGRTAVLLEVEQVYCDVICRRFQEHTGIVPTRLGVAHDFTK